MSYVARIHSLRNSSAHLIWGNVNEGESLAGVQRGQIKAGGRA